MVSSDNPISFEDKDGNLIRFSANTNHHVIMKIRLLYDGLSQAEFFRSYVEAYINNDALILEFVSDTVEQNTSLPTLDHTLTVKLSVIVRGDVPDTVADPIIESAHSKIMADLTVNNLAIDIQPSDTTMESIDADQPAGVLSADFIVIYRTEIDDLTQ